MGFIPLRPSLEGKIMSNGRKLLALLPIIIIALASCNIQPEKPLTEAPTPRIVVHNSLNDALHEIDGLPFKVVSGGFRGSLSDAVEQLADTRVVLVGETHNRYEHHLVQLAILRAIHQRHPAMALGVEWFQQDVQTHLDNYIAGTITEAQMLHRTEYYERWRFDYRHYRPIMEYAREHRIPVLALNAPASITRQIGREGIESLSDEARSRLPTTLDRSNSSYVERIREAYEAHPESEQPFDNFLTVQLVWDETMARNTARYLEQNPGHRMVVLAGTGHAGYRSAIPDRIVRRLPVSTITVVTENQLPDTAPAAGSADVVVVGPALELTPSGKLGVLIHTEQSRVLITKVLEESGAFKSGIRAGDQIVKLDGREIRSFSDLKLALLHQRPGDTVNVQVKSDNEPSRDLQVILQ